MAEHQKTSDNCSGPDKSLSADEKLSSPGPSSPGSTDEARAPESPGGGLAHVPEDRQETVISKTPPLMDAAARRPATPSELGTVLEGAVLGHFRLVEFVGGGGMGAVFRAEDTMLGRPVAVKILSGDHTDEDVLRRFKNEAQSAARLDHDNIARVHYVGEDKGYNYIVFEFVEGHNIRDLVVQKGPLSLEETIAYTLQVAEALEHAFRRDVVHRDIKPSNVLITSDGHVKLVDMGLARLHQVESPETELTASGVTLGTFDYISPEQARDPRAADVRSDLYSLGCTFYFMLTGRPPFPEGTVLQKLLSHSSDERPDPRLYRPDLPEEVTVIVNKMLATHSQQRYQEPGELIGELLLLANQLGLHNATRGGTVWISNRGSKATAAQRLTPVLIPIAALIVLIFGLDHFWPTPSDNDIKRTSPELKAAISHADEDANPSDPRSPSEDPRPPSDTDSVKTDKPPHSTQRVDDGHTTKPEAADPSVAVHVETDGGGLEDMVQTPPDLHGIGPAPLAVAADAASQGERLALRVADSSANLSAAETPSSPNPPSDVRPVRLLIVGSADVTAPRDALVVESLASACELAKEHPELEAIELRFDGTRVAEPFEFSCERLTIRAGVKSTDVKYTPVLLFRPQERGVDANGRMIRIIGGAVQWEDVHFVLQLPQEAAGLWSLFHLNQVDRIGMQRCTMTIQNASFDGIRHQDDVAFFEFAKRPKNEGMRMPGADEEMMVMPPSIILNRCAARGEADLIRAPCALPFRLNWVQGLFVTSECLVRTGGMPLPPEQDDRIRIDLQHVTTFLGSGLCYVELNENDPHILGLEVKCSDSIFLTDSYTALIEHVGVADVAQVESSKLKFTGMRNIYPNTDPNRRSKVCWRIESAADAQSTKVFDLRKDEGIEMWWSERSQNSALENDIRQHVVWQREPSEGYPIHFRDASDYTLNEDVPHDALRSDDNLNNAGFSKTLPDFPPVSEPMSVRMESADPPTAG